MVNFGGYQVFKAQPKLPAINSAVNPSDILEARWELQWILEHRSAHLCGVIQIICKRQVT